MLFKKLPRFFIVLSFIPALYFLFIAMQLVYCKKADNYIADAANAICEDFKEKNMTVTIAPLSNLNGDKNDYKALYNKIQYTFMKAFENNGISWHPSEGDDDYPHFSWNWENQNTSVTFYFQIKSTSGHIPESLAQHSVTIPCECFSEEALKPSVDSLGSLAKEKLERGWESTMKNYKKNFILEEGNIIVNSEKSDCFRLRQYLFQSVFMPFLTTSKYLLQSATLSETDRPMKNDARLDIAIRLLDDDENMEMTLTIVCINESMCNNRTLPTATISFPINLFPADVKKDIKHKFDLEIFDKKTYIKAKNFLSRRKIFDEKSFDDKAKQLSKKLYAKKIEFSLFAELYIWLGEDIGFSSWKQVYDKTCDYVFTENKVCTNERFRLLRRFYNGLSDNFLLENKFLLWLFKSKRQKLLGKAEQLLFSDGLSEHEFDILLKIHFWLEKDIGGFKSKYDVFEKARRHFKHDKIDSEEKLYEFQELYEIGSFRIDGKNFVTGPPFKESGKSSQNWEFLPDTVNMPPARISQEMPDQDGTFTIDSAVPTNP